MSDLSRVEAIFLGALEKGDPNDCAAYLDNACRDDEETRRQVERLLQAHPKARRYLEISDANADPTRSIDLGPTSELAGTVIGGRYKLLEPIGEGGMGSVWMAQQTEPVRRVVALKLIKAGMDTKAVLTRFEAERQALALMDHPNIARVLDAGASDEGRPFFVMELVKGVPITRYCDDRKLNLRQRLDLFIPVCQAVQHAHQKGVIHRDLKPSNILVARYDDKPVPKVIDFGVAKAAGQPLTDRTLVTGFGAVVGTPEYMSPEQAQFNQLDVDTRSDIYALGVLLYELLTGSTPVTRNQLEKAGLLEVLRMIRETEPPRPSTRLSTAQGLPLIAANRGSEAKTLAGLLRNDLDWIVMKSLEKDRNRRYETATGFAADIQRYLSGEAVQAHPPSAAYRMKKLARKHQMAIATASAFVGLLIAGIGISTAMTVRAKRAEVEAAKNMETAEKKTIEAEASAKEARRISDLYAGSLGKQAEAHFEAELTAASLQMDLDLAEIQTDPRQGLLRMAKTLKKVPEEVVYPYEFSYAKGTMKFGMRDHPRQTALREFATLAVLARGQEFAPLLPPLSNGGEVKAYDVGLNGRRVLTIEDDRLARLWDPYTARLIAILRWGDSKVIEVGISPDGVTAFTHSLDGVVRLWDAETGAFRAETDARPARVKLIQPDDAPTDPVGGLYPWAINSTSLSNDRILSFSMNCTVSLNPAGYRDYSAPSSTGPVELWNASTGQWIARLEIPANTTSGTDFSKDGRWIVVSDPDYVHVWSASDGKIAAKLPLDGDSSRLLRRSFLSPSGRTMATFLKVRKGPEDVTAFMHLWDTSSWKRLSITGPFASTEASSLNFSLIDDDRILADRGTTTWICRAGSTTPIAEVPGSPNRIAGNRAWFSPEIVFDASTWQRLRPPPGRKYHPDLARFSADGRFLQIFTGLDEEDFIDTVTEKKIHLPSRNGFWNYQTGLGWFAWLSSEMSTPLRLPPTDRLNLPPELLELWVQVAVRGELDGDGTFVPWKEPTWEKKRQELAAKPAPYPDFPFPGRVAQDRSHWLRQEYETTGKPLTLARQLLDRAVANGDQAEANHWRRIIAQSVDPNTPTPAK